MASRVGLGPYVPKIEKKTVLVTGGGGFLGRETVKHLQENDWVVRNLTRCPKQDTDIECDLEGSQVFEQLGHIPHVDAIVHLASKVDFSNKSLEDFFLANIAATASLLTLAKQMDAHFVFASAALIAGRESRFINSDTKDYPDTPYMRSKLISENLISCSGVKYTTLRIGGIYGRAGPNHLGINRAIRDVMMGNPPELVGSGDLKRNYIYVKDVANIICYALSRKVFGKHLIAGKEVLSVSEMLQELCRIFLPMKSAVVVSDEQGFDQVIKPSPSFSTRFSFTEGLVDIQRGN